MRLIVAFVSLGLLGGCVMPEQYKQVEDNYQREFTYDYAVPGEKQAVLWKRARDHIAASFGDSKEVIRVASEEEGSIMGKGVSRWYLPGGHACLAGYDLRFMSKDGKARLQLEITTGSAAGSACPGWTKPSAPGYESIKADFESLNRGLGEALASGSKMDKMKDF